VGTKPIGDSIHPRRRQTTRRHRATGWNGPAGPECRACRTHSSRALQFSGESLREERASSQIRRKFFPLASRCPNWWRAAERNGALPGLPPLVTADGLAVEGPPPSKRHGVNRRSPTYPRSQGRRILREVVVGYIRIRVRQWGKPYFRDFGMDFPLSPVFSTRIVRRPVKRADVCYTTDTTGANSQAGAYRAVQTMECPA
jgi:hypothetical protein